LPVLPGILAIALMASLPMLRAFLVFLGSILAASTRPCWLAWNKDMHVCIYSQCTNAFIFSKEMHRCIFSLMGKGFDDFVQAKKSPLDSGLCLTQGG